MTVVQDGLDRPSPARHTSMGQGSAITDHRDRAGHPALPHHRNGLPDGNGLIERNLEHAGIHGTLPLGITPETGW